IPVSTSPIRRLAVVATAAALTLTACGSDTPETESTGGTSALEQVTVEAAPDDATTPKVTFEPGSLAAEETESKVVTAGDGAELGGTELISFDYATFSGETAEEVGSSYASNP